MLSSILALLALLLGLPMGGTAAPPTEPPSTRPPVSPPVAVVITKPVLVWNERHVPVHAIERSDIERVITNQADWDALMARLPEDFRRLPPAEKAEWRMPNFDENVAVIVGVSVCSGHQRLLAMPGEIRISPVVKQKNVQCDMDMAYGVFEVPLPALKTTDRSAITITHD